MTEAEFLTSDDPAAMLAYLQSQPRLTGRPWGASPWMASDRKLRLFACASARRYWAVMPGEPRRAVEAAERHADGLATADEMVAAGWHAAEAFRRAARLVGGAQVNPEWPMDCGAERSASLAAFNAIDPRDTPEEKAAQAALLRDVVGNPFRHVNLRHPLPWVVVNLAHAADERHPGTGHLDPFRLALLADALEEAGCPDGDMLRHLRGWERRRLRCDKCAAELTRQPMTGMPDLSRCTNDRCGATHGPFWQSVLDGKWVASPGPHVRGCWAVDAVLGRQ